MKLAENPEFPTDTNQFPNNQQPDSTDNSQNFEDSLHTDFEVTFNLPGVDPNTTHSDNSDAESYTSAPAESNSSESASDAGGEAAEDVPPAVGLADVDADVEAFTDADDAVPIMEGLRTAIIDAFNQVGRSATISMPTFSGKKGDKPEGHILRFNDYFNHYGIAADRKSEEFVKTLTSKARTWIESVPKTPRDDDHPDPRLPVFDPADEAAPAAVAACLRQLFLTRFAPQGRTPEALYAEWQNLHFDSSKDDVEEFVDDVKKLAKKVAMPVEIQNLLLTMNDFTTLKPFLIKVFDNPKMKQVYGKKSDGASTSSAGAFTAVKSQDPPVPNSLSYFCSKMDKLEDKLGQLTLFDNRPRRPPFKLTATPRRG